MLRISIWRVLIVGGFLLGTAFGCGDVAGDRIIKPVPNAWITLDCIPQGPGFQPELMETFVVTTDGMARRSVHGVLQGTVLLSKDQVLELRGLISKKQDPPKYFIVDAPLLHLVVWSTDGRSTSLLVGAYEVDSIPRQIQDRMRADFKIQN